MCLDAVLNADESAVRQHIEVEPQSPPLGSGRTSPERPPTNDFIGRVDVDSRELRANLVLGQPRMTEVGVDVRRLPGEHVAVRLERRLIQHSRPHHAATLPGAHIGLDRERHLRFACQEHSKRPDSECRNAREAVRRPARLGLVLLPRSGSAVSRRPGWLVGPTSSKPAIRNRRAAQT